MILLIDDHLKLSSVQEKFSDSYPGLKLMFYKKEPKDRNAVESDSITDERVYIGDIRKRHHAGQLQIFSWLTVNEVEAAFRKNFGLNVRIFRNELNQLIPVTHSAKYTLRGQQAFSRNAAVTIDPVVAEQLDEYGYL